MAVKELRQGLRARMFILPFLLVQLVAVAALGAEYLAQRDAAGAGMAAGRSIVRLTPSSMPLPGFFWTTAWIITGVLMPFRCMNALREESGDHNAELLIMGGLTRLQIARGKWLVQIGLSALTLLSLAPHMLARYFLGGVDLIESLFSMVAVLACAAGVSGCVIGASGYRGTGQRLLVMLVCGFWITVASIAAAVAARVFRDATGLNSLKIANVYACSVLALVLYALLGLQLARAHLKLSLLPYELAPTRTVVTLMVTTPFILACGFIATCGQGAIFVLVIMIFAVWNFDKRTVPVPVLPSSTGY